MLSKYILYQRKEFPNKKVIILEKMIMPLGDYSYCLVLEKKINEYLVSIHLKIAIFILEIEKKEEELYRQNDEFAWIVNDSYIDLKKMNNSIILENNNKKVLLSSYELFEPIYKLQLENIYSFLKTNYHIDEYFRKKYEYENLKNKLKTKNKEEKINKI